MSFTDFQHFCEGAQQKEFDFAWAAFSESVMCSAYKTNNKGNAVCTHIHHEVLDQLQLNHIPEFYFSNRTNLPTNELERYNLVCNSFYYLI